MKFRAHDTFFIRKGWLSKGMKAVQTKPDVFKRTQTKSFNIHSFFNDTATTEIYTLSLHDALPI